MADEKDSKLPEESGTGNWEKASSGYERGDSLREGPHVTASRAGAIAAGVEATAEALALAKELGYPKYQWAFDFYADVKAGQAACVPIALDKATSASGLVRFYEGKGAPRSGWHIGGLLKDYPSLRPRTQVKCWVTRGVGPGGVPALIIPLKAGISTQTIRRNGGGVNPGSQSAAAGDWEDESM